MTTFTPTHDVVTEATAAGFFPPRHNVEITQVTELTDRVMRLTFRDPFIASHAKPAQFVNLFTHDDFMAHAGVRSASAKSTATKSA